MPEHRLSHDDVQDRLRWTINQFGGSEAEEHDDSEKVLDLFKDAVKVYYPRRIPKRLNPVIHHALTVAGLAKKHTEGRCDCLPWALDSDATCRHCTRGNHTLCGNCGGIRPDQSLPDHLQAAVPVEFRDSYQARIDYYKGLWNADINVTIRLIMGEKPATEAAPE